MWRHLDVGGGLVGVRSHPGSRLVELNAVVSAGRGLCLEGQTRDVMIFDTGAGRGGETSLGAAAIQSRRLTRLTEAETP